MPKRMISDVIWKSKKLRSVQPPELRAEYNWIIPIVEDNGVFEFDPEKLWAEAYALARPGWTPEQVEVMLNEFIRVGLLIKYQAEDKTWCYLSGSDKSGLLPPPSQRYCKFPLPPTNAALGSSKDTQSEAYGHPRVALGQPFGTHGDAVTGFGFGFSLGDGFGLGSGSGSGSVNKLIQVVPSELKTEDTDKTTAGATAKTTATATATAEGIPLRPQLTEEHDPRFPAEILPRSTKEQETAADILTQFVVYNIRGYTQEEAPPEGGFFTLALKHARAGLDTHDFDLSLRLLNFAKTRERWVEGFKNASTPMAVFFSDKVYNRLTEDMKTAPPEETVTERKTKTKSKKGMQPDTSSDIFAQYKANDTEAD